MYEFILAMHNEKKTEETMLPSRCSSLQPQEESQVATRPYQRIRSDARYRVYFALPLAGLLPFGGPAGLLPFAAGALPAAALPAGAPPPANALP